MPVSVHLTTGEKNGPQGREAYRPIRGQGDWRGYPREVWRRVAFVFLVRTPCFSGRPGSSNVPLRRNQDRPDFFDDFVPRTLSERQRRLQGLGKGFVVKRQRAGRWSVIKYTGAAMEGWVYIMENRAMPGLVKLGQSTHIPEWRARRLSGTSVPHSFTVAYRALVEDYQHVETAIKVALKPYREGKEFFRCAPLQAVEVIRSVAGAAIAYERLSSTGEQKRTPPNETSVSAEFVVECL